MIKKNCIGRYYYNVNKYFAADHTTFINPAAYNIVLTESQNSIYIPRNYSSCFFHFPSFYRNQIEIFNEIRLRISISVKNVRVEQINESTLVGFLNTKNIKDLFHLIINPLISLLQYFQFYLGLVIEFIKKLYIKSPTLKIQIVKRKFDYHKISILLCSIDIVHTNLFLTLGYLRTFFSIFSKFESFNNINNIKLKLMATSDKITTSGRSELELGRTLFQIRNKKKISLNQLSKLTKISHSYLSEIENDKKVPNIQKLETICKALDVPMIIVLYLSKNKNKIQDQFKKQVFENVSEEINTLIDVLY